jgi:hypothetical protein
MFYNARWYDPALGRFAQADTVVPGGVQGLDRYAYANNNPLFYTDPTGHDSVPTEEHSPWDKIQKALEVQVNDSNSDLNKRADQGEIGGIFTGAVTGAVATGLTAAALCSVVPVLGTTGCGIGGAIVGGIVGGIVGYAAKSKGEEAKEDVAAISSLMDSAAANAEDGTVDYYFETVFDTMTDSDTGVTTIFDYTITFNVFDETNNTWLRYEFQSLEGYLDVLDAFQQYGLEPDTYCYQNIDYDDDPDIEKTCSFQNDTIGFYQ